MYNAADRLRELASDGKVRIMPELHDCASAEAAEINGLGMTMVSSGDPACALTGVPDLQLSSIDDFRQVTDRITNMTQMPLVIDADGGFGFGRGLDIYVGCKRIMRAGAADVLVTDTSELGRAGQPPIKDAALRFKAIRDGLDADDRRGFLIARCDTNPEEDSDDCVARLKAYWEAGAGMLCILWMHKMKNDKHELCRKLRDTCNCPIWYPNICGTAYDPRGITMEQLKDLGNYKLMEVHYSMHTAVLAILDVRHHMMMEQNNNYMDYHFDDTRYKYFTTMSMFGLTNKYWADLENSYVREPQDSITQRNYDYFVRPDDVHDPDKKEK